MKEFGGYLPLELAKGKEYFFNYEEDLLRLNCGRSAIHCALEDSMPTKVYIPRYNCDTVREPFDRLKIPFEYYNVDGEFNPLGVELGPREYLFYVNYFGLKTQDETEAIMKKYQRVYFDNTQAFFIAPIRGAYNIYSCRKFFGVSDGAYLIKEGLQKKALEKDRSAERMFFLISSIEKSTNELYQDHLRNEAVLAKQVLEMSESTKRILESVDYGRVKSQRKENFLFLHNELKQINEFQFPVLSDTPMVYPLLVRNEKLRGALIEKKIYVPSWWKYILDLCDKESIEYDFSKYLLPLPIDQRYTKKEMKEMVDIIQSCVKEIRGED